MFEPSCVPFWEEPQTNSTSFTVGLLPSIILNRTFPLLYWSIQVATISSRLSLVDRSTNDCEPRAIGLFCSKFLGLNTPLMQFLMARAINWLCTTQNAFWLML